MKRSASFSFTVTVFNSDLIFSNILDSIEERYMRRQTITYALFATDSKICVTFSDTTALIWDLHQRQCIDSVNLELY